MQVTKNNNSMSSSYMRACGVFFLFVFKLHIFCISSESGQKGISLQTEDLPNGLVNDQTDCFSCFFNNGEGAWELVWKPGKLFGYLPPQYMYFKAYHTSSVRQRVFYFSDNVHHQCTVKTHTVKVSKRTLVESTGQTCFGLAKRTGIRDQKA